MALTALRAWRTGPGRTIDLPSYSLSGDASDSLLGPVASDTGIPYVEVWNGYSWSLAANHPTDPTYADVSGTSTDTLSTVIVQSTSPSTYSSSVYSYDGTAWAAETSYPLSANPIQTAGTSASNVISVYLGSTAVYSYNGTTWNSENARTLSGSGRVSGTSTSAVFGSNSSTSTSMWNGTSWTSNTTLDFIINMSINGTADSATLLSSGASLPQDWDGAVWSISGQPVIANSHKGTHSANVNSQINIPIVSYWIFNYLDDRQYIGYEVSTDVSSGSSLTVNFPATVSKYDGLFILFGKDDDVAPTSVTSPWNLTIGDINPTAGITSGVYMTGLLNGTESSMTIDGDSEEYAAISLLLRGFSVYSFGGMAGFTGVDATPILPTGTQLATYQPAAVSIMMAAVDGDSSPATYAHPYPHRFDLQSSSGAGSVGLFTLLSGQSARPASLTLDSADGWSTHGLNLLPNFYSFDTTRDFSAAVADDILVMVLSAGFETSSRIPVAPATPAGWTVLESQVFTSNSQSVGLFAYYKIATGSETTVTWTTSELQFCAARHYIVDGSAYDGASIISGIATDSERSQEMAIPTLAAADGDLVITGAHSDQNYANINFLPVARAGRSNSTNYFEMGVSGHSMFGIDTVDDTIVAWASGAATSTAHGDTHGFGGATDAVVAGGFNTVGTRIATSEEYNGSVWSAGGTMSTTRGDSSACGTQSAGLVISGFSDGTLSTSTTEYNGTSWSAGSTTTVATQNSMACGSQTSVMLGFGETTTSAMYSYNGTAWAIQTDPGGLYPSGAVVGTGDSDAILENDNRAGTYQWDGIAWTRIADGLIVIFNRHAGGTTSDAIIYGGGAGNYYSSAASQIYNGTTWSMGQMLLTGRRQGMGGGSSSVSAIVAGGTTYALTPTYLTSSEYLSTGSGNSGKYPAIAMSYKETTSAVAKISLAIVIPASGGATRLGSSSLTSTASLTAIGSNAYLAQANLSSSATLVPLATNGPNGASSLVSSSTLTASALNTVNGASSLSGTGTVDAFSGLVFTGASSLFSNGTITALSNPLVQSIGSLVSSSSITATTSNIIRSTALLPSTATLGLTTSPIVPASASLSSLATMDIIATPVKLGFASLSSRGTIKATAAQLGLVLGELNLISSGSVTAVAKPLVSATSQVTGTTTLIADPSADRSLNTSLQSTSNTSGTGRFIYRASTSLDEISSVDALGGLTSPTSATLTASSSITSDPSIVRGLTNSLVSSSTITAFASSDAPSAVITGSVSTLTASSVATRESISSLNTIVSINGNAEVVKVSTGLLESTATMDSSGLRVRSASSVLASSSSIVPFAGIVYTFTGLLAETSTITASPVDVDSGVATLNAQAILGAVGILDSQITASLSSSATTAPTASRLYLVKASTTTSSTLGAAGSVVLKGSAGLTTTSSLLGIPGRVITATIYGSSTSTITANPVAIRDAKVSLVSNTLISGGQFEGLDFGEAILSSTSTITATPNAAVWYVESVVVAYGTDFTLVRKMLLDTSYVIREENRGVLVKNAVERSIVREYRKL